MENPRGWQLGLLMVSIGAMACFEVSDGDLGFHLATGRAILHSGHIPARNILSFAEPEQPWLLHQWLPALLFEWLWQHAGLAGLMSLKLLVLAATWACVYGAGRALGAPPLWAAVSCVLAGAASAFRFELRPYLFTHLTLAIAWCALARSAGAPQARLGPQLWAAAVALALGCQLHAGALDTALVMAIFGAGVALEPWRARAFAGVPLRPHGARAALGVYGALVAGLACASLLLASYHPWGARSLGFAFEMATHRYWAEHLVEFRHAWELPWSQLLGAWCQLGLVAVCLVTRARRTHAGVWLCALAYAGLSLWYARQAFAFGIVSAPLVATALTAAAARVRLPLSAAAVNVFFGLLCVAAPAFVYRDHTPGLGFSPWTWPRAQFAFIREHALRGHAFVSDAWGGPFLGEFYPERRVFFDNRLEAYSDAFARETYQRIRYGEPGWDALLDRYAIEFLVLRYTTPGEARFQHGRPNLRQHLAHDPRYSLVYFDDVGELFVRTHGDNAALATSYAIPGVDPDRHAFLMRPALAAPALLRAAGRAQPSLTMLGLTALALGDAGDLPHARALAQAMRARAPDDEFTTRVIAWLAR